MFGDANMDFSRILHINSMGKIVLPDDTNVEDNDILCFVKFGDKLFIFRQDTYLEFIDKVLDKTSKNELDKEYRKIRRLLFSSIIESDIKPDNMHRVIISKKRYKLFTPSSDIKVIGKNKHLLLKNI